MILDAITLTVCAAMVAYCFVTLNRMTEETHELARAAVVVLLLGALSKLILTISLAFPHISVDYASNYVYLDRLWVVCVGLFLLFNRRNPKC